MSSALNATVLELSCDVDMLQLSCLDFEIDNQLFETLIFHRNRLTMSQENETSGPEVWQINVLYDVDNTSTLILTVSKNCYTAELFDKLRQHPKAPQTDDFQLYSISGSIRSSLVESQEQRLSNYDITDRSTLALVARLPGGIWPTAKEVATEPRHLRPADGITLTTISAEHPDIFWLEHDGPGVIMRCGHATAPMPLALYCLTELEKGKDEIRCPECDAKWKFALLKPAACLTSNEITEFEKRAHLNFFRNHQSEMNPCPNCGTFSRPQSADDKHVVCENCTLRSGTTYGFCWTCLGEWKTPGNETCGNPDCGSNKQLLEILASCETKKLNGIDLEVPSKRACPNCSSIIHHDEGCKHMTCASCSYEFCFICLERFPCATDVYKPCDVAPRQTSDTIFIGATVAFEDELHSVEPLDGSDESPSDETDEDSNDARVNLCSTNRDELMAALMDDDDINIVLNDDVTVNADDDIITQPESVALSANNDDASATTADVSVDAISAAKATVDNSLSGVLSDAVAHDDSGCHGEIAQLQMNTHIPQPSESLETKKAVSIPFTETNRPANWSSFREHCIIQ